MKVVLPQRLGDVCTARLLPGDLVTVYRGSAPSKVILVIGREKCRTALSDERVSLTYLWEQSPRVFVTANLVFETDERGVEMVDSFELIQDVL